MEDIIFENWVRENERVREKGLSRVCLEADVGKNSFLPTVSLSY